MISLVINPQVKYQVDGKLIRRAAKITLSSNPGKTNSDLSVVIGDDKQLQELNKSFRGIDKPTDVLSFPSDLVDPQSGREYLGDVVISFDRVKFQSEQIGHSIEIELQLLTVHGILHLLGYDHDTEENKNVMWDEQGKILSLLGINAVKILEDQE